MSARRSARTSPALWEPPSDLVLLIAVGGRGTQRIGLAVGRFPVVRKEHMVLVLLIGLEYRAVSAHRSVCKRDHTQRCRLCLARDACRKTEGSRRRFRGLV